MAKKSKQTPDELDIGLAGKAIAEAMITEAKNSGVSVDSIDKVDFAVNILSTSKFKFVGGDEDQEFNWNDQKAKASLFKRIDKCLNITTTPAKPSKKAAVPEKKNAAPEPAEAKFFAPSSLVVVKGKLKTTEALPDGTIALNKGVKKFGQDCGPNGEAIQPDVLPDGRIRVGCKPKES